MPYKQIRQGKTFVGAIHNNLTITEIVSGRDCLAKCGLCGKVKKYKRNNFLRTSNCGCGRKGKRNRPPKPNGESARNIFLYSYKSRAAKRKFEWGLSDEEFDRLTTQICHYCGEPPNQEKRANSDSGDSIFRNGVDRKDNAIGYFLDNCVPCCKICNWTKNRLNENEFLSLVEKIQKHQEISYGL